MTLTEFQARLTALGIEHAITTPAPDREFTIGKFGTTIWREDGPEIEMRMPDTPTRRGRVRAISVEGIEVLTDLMLLDYIKSLKP